jgi:ABC-2 type transport system ATP-binding protein
VLQADDLERHFQGRPAVSGVSFCAGQGEVVGFLGPNGAGKTTTLRMLAGQLEPDRGRVSIDGIDIWANRRAAQARLGYLPEGAPLPDDLTPLSFLRLVASLRGYAAAKARRATDHALWGAQILDVAEQPIGTLSKGYRRRVAFAAAILADPPVLLLDEPTDGLDPNQKRTVRGLIAAMAPHKAILISTHALDEVEAMCSRVIVIDRGRIVADNTPAGLVSGPAGGGPHAGLEAVFHALTAATEPRTQRGRA